MKKSRELCTCSKYPIEPQLRMCQDCFAKGVVVMESFMQIQRDYGLDTALAARPIIEKCVETGWKDEYLAEFQANLKQRLEVQSNG